MTTARWRSTGRAASRYGADLLYHVSDGHGKHGVLPDFSHGETWEDLHEDLHDRDDFGGKGPHER